jgi:hypothetical protein
MEQRRSSVVSLSRSRFACSSLLATTLLAAGLVACDQKAPPPSSAQAPYDPLVDGSWWDYQHDDWTEHVALTSTTLESGESAFVLTDSPNPKDGIRSDATLVARGGRVLRVYKEEYLIGANDEATLKDSVSYGVGFTRFDEGWADKPVGFRETPEYERVETPAGGAAKAAQGRRHTFEILSLSAQVTTPLGTFDCIQIRRTKDWQAEEEGLDASDAQPKVFWFARGVGKVRELNLDSGKGELLVNYFIPEPGTPGSASPEFGISGASAP